MELLIAVLGVAPAVAFAAVRSSRLMDYAIWVLALNRGVRRLVDYGINGEFNPYSPISLAPLVVGGLLLLTGLTRFSSLGSRARAIFAFFFVAVVMALVIGLLRNGFGAVYSFGEWLSGLGAMLFAATHPRGAEAGDRWMRTAGWAAVFVAAYGWIQYLTIPPWDALWLEQSGMIGYMGVPIPTRMTCFSTLNERGPCAGFLGWAVLPMLLQRRWRNPLGWFVVLLILSAMLLTEVRSMFIVVGLAALLQPLLASGRGLGRILLAAAVLVAAVSFGLEHIPGVERFAKRFETSALAGKGSSAHVRLGLYAQGLSLIAAEPLGLGLGSSGIASKRTSSGGGEGVFDAGYIQVVAQFGWAGALCFFGALMLLWRESSARWRERERRDQGAVDPFLPLARSLLLSMLVLLGIADVFAGFSLVWIIFGRAVAGPDHGSTTGGMSGIDGESPPELGMWTASRHALADRDDA